MIELIFTTLLGSMYVLNYDACTAQKITLHAYNQSDSITSCLEGLISEMDMIVFKSDVDITQDPNATTVFYQIKKKEDQHYTIICVMDIQNDCNAIILNKVCVCKKNTNNKLEIKIILKANHSLNGSLMKGTVVRSLDHELVRSEEKTLPNIYASTDTNFTFKIDNRIIQNNLDWVIVVRKQELFAEFLCASPASPCLAEISSDNSTYKVLGRDKVIYHSLFKRSQSFTLIVKHAACSLEGNINELKRRIQIELEHKTDQESAFDHERFIPLILTPLILMCIFIAFLLKTTIELKKKKKHLSKNDESQSILQEITVTQPERNDEREYILQNMQHESKNETRNQNDSVDRTAESFKNNSTSARTDLMDAIHKGKDLKYIFNLISSESVDNTDDMGRTALMHAAKLGNTEVVTRLTEHDCHLEARDKCGRTALIVAAQYKRKDIVRILVERNSDVQVKTNRDWNALMYASLSGQDEICEILLNRAKVDDTNQSGRTCLMFASRNGHAKTVGVLIKYGADVNATDTSGNTPLMFAAENGQVETVKVLLNRGADPFLKNKDEWTALTFAEQNGFCETAKCLKEHFKRRSHDDDYDFHRKNTKTRTELMKEIHKGKDVPYLSSIISCKENVDDRDEKGRTALMHAAKLGNTEAVRLLAEHNCNLEAKDNRGRTTLIIAAQYKRKDIVKIIVERNVDVNEKTNCGWTALMYASLSGQHEICEILLLNKANVNYENKCGKTCLMYASRNGHPKTVDVLIKNGADVNAKDECDETPLMFAADNGHIETVKVLLNSNADPSLKNKDFWTAVTFAEQSGFSNIATCIKEYSLKN